LEEPSKVSPIPLERHPPGIHMPPLWASFSTPGVDQLLHKQGVQLIISLDDILIMVESVEIAKGHANLEVNLLTSLGFDQPQKVSSNSQSTIRVSKVHSHDSVLNPGQTSSNQAQ